MLSCLWLKSNLLRNQPQKILYSSKMVKIDLKSYFKGHNHWQIQQFSTTTMKITNLSLFKSGWHWSRIHHLRSRRFGYDRWSVRGCVVLGRRSFRNIRRRTWSNRWPSALQNEPQHHRSAQKWSTFQVSLLLCDTKHAVCMCQPPTPYVTIPSTN